MNNEPLAGLARADAVEEVDVPAGDIPDGLHLSRRSENRQEDEDAD